MHEEVQNCQLQILFIPAIFVLLENHASNFEISQVGRLTFYRENNSDQAY